MHVVAQLASSNHETVLLAVVSQGWPSPGCCDDEIRARNICFAHGLAASLPEVIAVTHNFFQDSKGGSEQGGQDYGLIAGNISGDLSDGTGYPTFDAYNATSPTVWGRSDANYCCEKWRVGCLSTFNYGTLDPLDAKGGGDPPALSVHGWAWSTAGHRAGLAPVGVTVTVDGRAVVQQGAAVAVANASRPDLVAAAVAPSPNHGFKIDLPISVCRDVQRGKHTIRVHAALLPLPSHAPPHSHPRLHPHSHSHSISESSEAGAEAGVWELDSSPRCLCDFTACPC
jgi:hypothetical protein